MYQSSVIVVLTLQKPNNKQGSRLLTLDNVQHDFPRTSNYDCWSVQKHKSGYLTSFILVVSDLFQGALSSAITQNGGKTIVNFKDSDLPSHLCLSESEFTKASNAKG